MSETKHRSNAHRDREYLQFNLNIKRDSLLASVLLRYVDMNPTTRRGRKASERSGGLSELMRERLAEYFGISSKEKLDEGTDLSGIVQRALNRQPVKYSHMVSNSLSSSDDLAFLNSRLNELSSVIHSDLLSTNTSLSTLAVNVTSLENQLHQLYQRLDNLIVSLSSARARQQLPVFTQFASIVFDNLQHYLIKYYKFLRPLLSRRH